MSPCAATIYAFGFMDAQQPATLRTCPFVLFPVNKYSHPKTLDSREIVNHARAVLGSISRIQMDEPGAWKAVTLKTEFDAAANNAFLNVTRSAGY